MCIFYVQLTWLIIDIEEGVGQQEKVTPSLFLSACDCFTSHVKWEAQATLSSDLYGYPGHTHTQFGSCRRMWACQWQLRAHNSMCSTHTHTRHVCVLLLTTLPGSFISCCCHNAIVAIVIISNNIVIPAGIPGNAQGVCKCACVRVLHMSRAFQLRNCSAS